MPSFEGEKLSINLIPVGTMSNEFSREGRSGGFINFIYSDKQPLTMESLFDFFNIFDFHKSHLILNDIINSNKSQRKYNEFGFKEMREEGKEPQEFSFVSVKYMKKITTEARKYGNTE